MKITKLGNKSFGHDLVAAVAVGCCCNCNTCTCCCWFFGPEDITSSTGEL